jgi:hypothetical protein
MRGGDDQHVQAVKARLGDELYETARQLGVRSELLFLLGSYGQDQSDESLRDALRARNDLRRGRRARQAPHEVVERQIAEEVHIAFQNLSAPPLVLHVLRLWRDGAKMAEVRDDLRKLNREHPADLPRHLRPWR